jgi:hypothetical protein
MFGDYHSINEINEKHTQQVKWFSADDSVAVCHVKVGNCQALKSKTRLQKCGRVFFMPEN